MTNNRANNFLRAGFGDDDARKAVEAERQAEEERTHQQRRTMSLQELLRTGYTKSEK